MKRFAALLVAVGLVVGAWYLRSNVIDDGGGGPSSSDTPTLICATEVRAACEELDDVDFEVLRTEDPGVTYDRLVAGKPLGAHGWLVSQPWPGMAEERGFSTGATSDVLRRSPMVVISRGNGPGRPSCPTALTWECVAAFASSGSTFAYGSKDTTGGLLARHGIAIGLIGEVDYASNDFTETDQFPARFPGIEGAVADAIQGRGPDLAADIQRFQGAYGAVAVLGSTAANLDARFQAVTPTPEITADVVLAGRPDRFDTEAISDALFTTGWLRSGDKSLSEANGLPKPGVMVALRELSR